MVNHKEIKDLRTKHLGPSLSLSYDEPLQIVRGKGQYLYDADGNQYLDCINNIQHVGHCHPKVVTAAQKQYTQLNTNTRYLGETIVKYAKNLTDTLPAGLEVCFFPIPVVRPMISLCAWLVNIPEARKRSYWVALTMAIFHH